MSVIYICICSWKGFLQLLVALSDCPNEVIPQELWISVQAASLESAPCQALLCTARLTAGWPAQGNNWVLCEHFDNATFKDALGYAKTLVYMIKTTCHFYFWGECTGFVCDKVFFTVISMELCFEYVQETVSVIQRCFLLLLSCACTETRLSLLLNPTLSKSRLGVHKKLWSNRSRTTDPSWPKGSPGPRGIVLSI